MSLGSASGADNFEFVYDSNNIKKWHNTGAWVDVGQDKNFATWDHHAWMIDRGAGTFNFFVNGILKYSDSNISTNIGGAHFEVGKMSTYFEGYMDEIALYSAAK